MTLKAFTYLLFSLLLTLLAKAANKPNILMILCDDVGFECFSAYGSKEYSTPRLDALAEGGIRFENCHSTPICTPSRVNLMSGKPNVFNYYDFGLYPKGEPTFGNYFKMHGYATAVAGKWQLARKAERRSSHRRPDLLLGLLPNHGRSCRIAAQGNQRW